MEVLNFLDSFDIKEPEVRSSDGAVPLDSEWIKASFLVSSLNMAEGKDTENMYWSTADLKLGDTRMGGTIGVNARPSFTRYADTRRAGRLQGRNEVTVGDVGGNYGYGRYYSEAIDDSAQKIFIRFGVPQFTSLMRFFSNAFDPDVGAWAKTGRGKSAIYTIAKTIGQVSVATALPIISATIWAGRALRMFFLRPTSKYYTLKPTPHLYWSAVNALVNSIAINRGILPRVFMENQTDQQMGTSYQIDQEMLTQLSQMFPTVISEENAIDCYAIANRAQRLYNIRHEQDFERYNKGSATDFYGLVEKSYQDKVAHPPGEPSLANFVRTYCQFGYWLTDDPKTEYGAVDPKDNPGGKEQRKAPADGDSFFNFFDANFNDGSAFAHFVVGHTGPVVDTFSNQTGESELGNKINQMASTAKTVAFNFAGGNIGDGVILNTLETMVGLAKDAVTGLIPGVTYDLSTAIEMVLSGTFIDVPKDWKTSTANLAKSTYKMTLISPYNNPISHLQNIYIPLCMILAGGLPRATGKQSWTSPFICQLYDRGRSQIQLGMIDSISVTRGTSNLGFNNKGVALAMEVSFSVTDLSSIMAMPTSTGSLFKADTVMDEDTILFDYLAVLAGQDLYSQLYQVPKAKLNAAKLWRGTVDKAFSPAYWASMIHSEVTDGLLGTLVPAGKLLSVVSPGTDVIK